MSENKPVPMRLFDHQVLAMAQITATMHRAKRMWDDTPSRGICGNQLSIWNKKYREINPPSQAEEWRCRPVLNMETDSDILLKKAEELLASAKENDMGEVTAPTTWPMLFDGKEWRVQFTTSILNDCPMAVYIIPAFWGIYAKDCTYIRRMYDDGSNRAVFPVQDMVELLNSGNYEVRR